MTDAVVKAYAKYVGDELLWKNAENGGYRTFALGTAKEFSLATSGLCCFDIILASAYDADKLDQKKLKTIYQAIVTGHFQSNAPLVKKDTVKTLARKEVGSDAQGSSVTKDWPAEGDLVFFRRKKGGTELDHVALAADNKGEILTFGEEVPSIAAKQNLTQSKLNSDGLKLKVARRKISDVWALFNGLVDVAKPTWG